MGLFSWFTSLFKKRSYSLNETMDYISDHWNQYEKQVSQTKYEFTGLARKIAKDFLSHHNTIRKRDIHRIVNMAISKSKEEQSYISEEEYKRPLKKSYNNLVAIIKRINKIIELYDDSFGPHPFLQIKINLLTEKKKLLNLAKNWKDLNLSYYRFAVDRTNELIELYKLLDNFDNGKVTMQFLKKYFEKFEFQFRLKWQRILLRKQEMAA